VLAGRRAISVAGTKVLDTPLLIPSFSSKGYPELPNLLVVGEQFITDVTLVSAYDVFYHRIEPPISFADVVFLDSGGYEAGKDHEYSDLGFQTEEPNPWTQDFYVQVLQRWPYNVPTVAVSFDHPAVRLPTDKQIQRAASFFPERKNLMPALLIKPETHNESVNIEALIDASPSLVNFAVLGVTDKELGVTVLDRMLAVARLRTGLRAKGVELPIHVFGSLDPVITPLYFLAGADIFDGLGWLRFGYSGGRADYWHMWGAREVGIDVPPFDTRANMMASNLFYLTELRGQMEAFVATGDFGAFKFHADFFKASIEKMLKIGG
jgi:hypothetical protein